MQGHRRHDDRYQYGDASLPHVTFLLYTIRVAPDTSMLSPGELLTLSHYAKVLQDRAIPFKAFPVSCLPLRLALMSDNHPSTTRTSIVTEATTDSH